MSAAAGDVRIERRGAVATLWLDRPGRHNALTLDLWRRLPPLLADLSADPSLRVLVVRGAGEAAFCSGADLGELATALGGPRAGADANRAAGATAATTGGDATAAPGTPTAPGVATAIHEAAAAAERALADVPVPTIAQVHGACFGGGAALALACDLRFADDRASFAVPAARLGIVYGLTATRRLAELAGPAAAAELLYGGLPFDAERAARVGLFDRVVAPRELAAATAAFADLLASRSPTSLRGAKALLRRVAAGQVDEDDDTLALRDAAYAGPDVREGVRALLERRPPDFGRGHGAVLAPDADRGPDVT